MSKKIIILYILLVVSFGATAQIFHETFESTTIPAGWTMTNSANCNWEFGFDGDINGSGYYVPASMSGAAVFIDEVCEDDDYTVELVSPEINLSGQNVSSAEIEVIYNHQTFSNDGDFYIKVWDGASWVTVLFVDGDSPGSNTGTNATAIIDVSSYINSAFKVKFEYSDQDSFTFGIAIDDLKVVDTATAGTEDLAAVGFRFYPNPVVNDMLSLRANEPIAEVEIYNSIGQKVLLRQPNTTSYTILMDHLPTGMYLANVSIGGKTGSFKILKK